MHREDRIQRLTELGVIAVVRLKDPAKALPLAKALIDGGLRAIEITMTTPNALPVITNLSNDLRSAAFIGVGSVLNPQIAIDAISAGAQFVVSPVSKLELVAVSHERGIPVMLGAYTPTEAQNVHESGADFVKLFPAETLGPAYVKSLLAPLPHLRIVPTGGVDEKNIRQFRLAGCKAVGIGSALISADWLARDQWDRLTCAARDYVQQWKSV